MIFVSHAFWIEAAPREKAVAGLKSVWAFLEAEQINFMWNSHRRSIQLYLYVYTKRQKVSKIFFQFFMKQLEDTGPDSCNHTLMTVTKLQNRRVDTPLGLINE